MLTGEDHWQVQVALVPVGLQIRGRAERPARQVDLQGVKSPHGTRLRCQRRPGGGGLHRALAVDCRILTPDQSPLTHGRGRRGRPGPSFMSMLDSESRCCLERRTVTRLRTVQRL